MFAKTRRIWIFALGLILIGATSPGVAGRSVAQTPARPPYASGPSAPIQITELSVNAEPLIGEVVTLRIEVKSMFDEPDAAIIVDLPPGVKLMDGELLWEGSLRANQPQTHELLVCALYEGDWRIRVNTYSRLSETSTYGDAETIHLIITTESGGSHV